MLKQTTTALCALSLALAANATEPARFTVTTNLLAPKPISPLLYGNFIELGYGVQVEPMMAQMFFNRSFEPFLPYKAISVEWFDLWNDPRDHSKGYKTDWTGEDWYHSGYEHNPWFVAPGTGGRLPIDDHATFIITNGVGVNASIRPEAGGSGHGVQHLANDGRRRDDRHLVRAAHDLVNLQKQRPTEPSAGMVAREVLFFETARFEQDHRQRVPEHHHDRRAGGRREI